MHYRHFLEWASWRLCILVVHCGTTAFAQSGGGYDLTWSTVDCGGATFSAGGGYELGGTIGQPDAGEQSGGLYGLTGGFWFGVVPIGFPCPSAVDCRNDPANNACNCATCTASTCQYTCTRFGNVTCDPLHLINLDDILCVQNGFSSFANCPNGDVNPCGGNGIINLDDILAVLAAFSGANPCGCLQAGTAPLCGSISP
jgi:hypothetical protein